MNNLTEAMHNLNSNKKLKEGYTEKDLQPGAKYYGPAGALITIVEPRKDGLPQFQMTNTNNGKVGKVITMGSYGELSQILSDNHYVKLGKENVEESLHEAVDEMPGEDVTNTFKNYKAYEANFEPIKIIKHQGHYYIYNTTEPVDYSSYINNTDSKDYIEGWLYGAVQTANKILKTK